LIAYSLLPPRQLSIGIRVIHEVLQKFDEEGNPITIEEGSKMGASNTPTLEDLMKRLEKLTAENNKLRRKIKAKRIKGGSSSSKEEDSSNEEDVSKKEKKGRNNRDKPSYNSMLSIMIICLALPLTLPYPLAKLPTLMELIIINGSIA
jgi:predicted RNase H-like nuclease (RuvC/YqgF family)